VLAYFVKVVELESFTAAARALHISQPSLSVAIRKLEEELGTQLLVRRARGVSPTATGEALVRRARAVLQTLDEVRSEIDGLETAPRGTFTIGCHESLAAYFLPAFMSRFLARYPEIRLSLWNGNSREVEREVIRGAIDVGLVVNPEEHPDCVVQPLFDDWVGLVVAASTLATDPPDARALIRSHPLVYVPALKQTQFILGSLAQRHIEPRQHLPCSSLELCKSLVLDGVGVGILPHRVATYNVAKDRVVALPLEGFDDTVALVRRFDLHLTQAARILLDDLLAHGREMPALPDSVLADSVLAAR
jgi:DNA-binding transcriptional LysR family regulator